MLVSLLPIISVLATFGSLTFFVYMHYTSRHREHMALIEQGKDPYLYRGRARKMENRNVLKYGILFTTFGLGLVAGWALEMGGFPSEVAYFSMIFMFGGFGMIIFYAIQGRKSRTEELLAEEL